MESRSDIQELTLEEVMGDRFGRYSKYIIQERALPDIRDGLKPVQRRILYAMNVEGNTSDKGFRKSAKTVGNVIGNYHPHGDSSVYEAMVRLSQNWKQREELVEMHGNNGSMDGDPPAAMRYTEARLSKIAEELLKDIDKETVDFVLNFDDTDEEPTVLPVRYPNLLVNGATGISAGYATDIPSHNLSEVIDATVYLIDHPQATAVDLMAYLKGPDFPTGGILQGIDGIRKAYETGKGKVIVRSKTHIEELRGGKQQIVINEIPYDVNKAVLVRKMDEIRLNKKIDGIAEVRDESDRTGLQIVVELKKDVNAQGILTYLLKSTDLQVSYNFNMVAIDKKRPQQVGIVRMLEAYLEHQNEVIVRRTQFNLRKAETRAHIVVGLIKALSILDEIIAAIRGSKDKKNAKDTIISKFGFTEEQAEAIVSLQLYRLTNTDITALESEADTLEKAIASFNKILTSPTEMKRVMKKELSEIKKKYGSPRRTVIENEIEELKVETEVLVTQEEVMVSVTKEGYLKRTSLRSYGASKPEEIGVREGDYPIFIEQLNTLHHLFLFTTKGNIIYRQVHEIADIRWKDSGEHLSQHIALGQDETILKAFGLKTLDPSATVTLISKEGFIKQSSIDNLFGRSYLTKSFTVMKLKTETDRVENIIYTENQQEKDVFLITQKGFGLRYPLSEVPIVGAKAGGVKSINLKKDDYVVNGIVFDTTSAKTDILIVTQRGSIKKMTINDFDTLGRAKRGLLVLRELKSNPHRVAFLLDGSKGKEYTIRTEREKEIYLASSSYQVSDRYSNGSFILDQGIDGSPVDIQTDIFYDLNKA
ncbi:DNA topoisomerase IV subunit A [Carnobacterium iners]|uniref:DNA topoisomerase 4 subunit A n=1 Tax=Carnobacterium iners TaxID=1073423 RepID=A0A1X7NG62_9LACT|nr:DNA topoisomerase IV subunit A [Carnobacterium iners]SEK38310.1 DNA topoisomerase IV subunit A [Carnobacterium iners]SMH36102.1 DNA topoisomerase IV subunit A [Carnobacterium iners]